MWDQLQKTEHLLTQVTPCHGQQMTTLLLPLTPIATDISNEPKKNNRDAFQADREVSSGETIVYCLKTATPINENLDAEVKKAIQDLTQLKKNIEETVHSYLIQDIFMNSKMITLPDGAGVPTRRIDDLCDLWSQNPSIVEQLWNVLVKRYEDMGEWELKFEREVMDSLNMEYLEENTSEEILIAELKDREGNVTKIIHRKKSIIRGNKGCVAKLVTLVKRDIIKQFNRAASSTHGITITSVNPVINVDGEGEKI